MKLSVHNSTKDFDSYRASRVKSLFNAESGADFRLEAEFDLTGDWRIGVIVGPSGSGKTSLGRQLWGDAAFWTPTWPHDAPIVDAISPGGDFDEVTAALAAVGLGTVPAWLRPYDVLSNGEKFRADLARLVCEGPDRAIVDEFTSVVDRQIARFGALAFAKAWRRKRRARSSCSRRTQTCSTGSSPTGSSTPGRLRSRRRVFGDDQPLSLRFSRQTAVIGRFLSRITI